MRKTRRFRSDVMSGASAMAAVLLCAGLALAEPANKPAQPTTSPVKVAAAAPARPAPGAKPTMPKPVTSAPVPAQPAENFKRPNTVSEAELAEIARRARASTQHGGQATTAPVTPPRPTPIAKQPPKPSPAPPTPPPPAPVAAAAKPETPSAEERRNRFRERLREARERAKEGKASADTPQQTAEAQPAAPKVATPVSQPVLPPPTPKLPAEQRKYLLSFHKAEWDEILNTFCRWSDLTFMGTSYPRAPVGGITYLNPRELTYHEAMHELNMLLMEGGYWMMKEKNHLTLRRLSDWPRYIPPENRFEDVKSFEKAKLDDDDWAMVFHTPDSPAVGDLIINIQQTMPDNVLRVGPVGETRRLKITGIVYYIKQFLRFADSPMFQPDESDKVKLRTIKFYKIEKADAASVQRVLQSIVLPERRGRIGTTVDEADRVDMVLDQMSNTIIVKAKQEYHDDIANMIQRIEASELVGDAKATFIKLEHARAEDLANILNPILTQQASMKPSYDRQRAQRERVFLQAEPASNSLIVLATKEGLEKVQELLKQLDVETPEGQYKRIELKNAKADQIYSVVNTLVQSRQMSRGRRMTPGQQLQVIPDPTGNALYVVGNPKDMEYVEKLVAELDKEDVERTKAHIVKLKKARPSTVAQGLQAIFGAEGGGRIRRGSPLGSFRVIPDEQSSVLVVICLEKDWKEVEPQIKEFDEQAVSMDPVMRTLEIKNGDAEEIANTLNNALRGRIGRASVVIGADRKNNMLFVTTLEPAFQEIESLVQKLDVPGKEGKLEVIPLENAAAVDVANLLTQMFQVQRRGGRFGGGGIEATIIPDPIANALVVRATKTDLEEVEVQARRIDDAAKGEGHKPTIITLEYADPVQTASLCETMFVGRTSRRGAEQRTYFVPMRTGLVVRAPAQQMEEIKAFIKSIDSPESENVEIKTVQLPGQDVEQIASILTRMFSGEQRRGRASGSMSFMPNPSADMIVIVAPKKRFEEIDKVIKQYTEGVKVTQATMKMFELQNARVDEVAELLTQMLGAKLSRGKRGGLSRDVQILREPRRNKLIVFAPEDVLKQAEDMIKQLDVPLGDEAAGVKWIALENTDAGYIASTLQQMWSQKQRRDRPKFRDLPVQIWPEAITNSVLVSAPPDEFKEIQELAKKLDAEAKIATTRPVIIPLQYQEPSYVISMCEQMFLPRTADGRGRRSQSTVESIAFIAMRDGIMVRAPQSRMKEIEAFIKLLDDPGEAKLTVKRYALKGMDVNLLHTTLNEVFAKMKLQRDETRPSFAVDAPNETVTVTCWTSRLPDIDKIVEDFKKAEGQKEPVVQEMIEVKFTRASYAASTLDGLLRKHLGDRAARLGARLSVSYEDRQNKVVLVAPPDVMADAKRILAEIDVRLPGATTQDSIRDLQVVQWIPMENIDASSAASTINQIWEASQPQQRAAENRPPIRIWPEPITNTVLVAGAYGKDFEVIQGIAKDIDQKAIENPNAPVLIKLEYVTPSEVTSMVSALFIPPGRRVQRDVAITAVSGGVIVRAAKIKLKEIQDFIAAYDKPEATGMKIKTFYLPKTNVSEVASTLNTIFGYKQRRHNEPGWSFIPNTSSEMLMVLAPEKRMKEIEDVIKEYESNVQKAESKMQMFEIKHTRANYVVGVLNELLREKLRRTRGRQAVEQLQISYESRQNKVVVFAPEDVMKQVEEMIKQIDVELPDDAEAIKWIQIEFADAAEVASTLSTFFQQKKGYKQRADSYSIQEVRIWPEMVTNSVLVSAPKKEFDEIAKLAKEIDDEYATKGLERVKITPKYVSVGQIQNMIQQLFYARTRRRDVRAQKEQVRIIPAGAYSFFLEAPKDRIAEVKKMIEEMDTEGENAPIIKTYKMGDVDVRRLAQALSQTTGGIGSYIPDARRGALIVSAPAHQFDRIEKAMEQLKADVKEEEAQFEVLSLKHARPSEAYSRLSQLVSMQLGRRRSRSDRELLLSMYPDDANNRLYVYAGMEEMLLVKKMLEQLDVPGLVAEAVLHTLPLKLTDCEYMASKIMQVFTAEEIKRRRAVKGLASQDTVPIRVVPEPTTNTLMITCAEEDFKEIELFVAKLEDAYVEKERALELFTPKYVSQGQLMATINTIYNPPRRPGERYQRYSDIRAIPASGSSFYLEAPKDKMVELKKLITDLDVEDKNRPLVRTYKLKDVDVRQLTRLLQTTMQGKGTYMADPQMGMVIVSAPEYQYKQIEEMMTKLQTEIEETRQQFEIIELKNARPSAVYGTLSQLVSMQMSQRRSRRDQGLQLSVIPDDSNGRLFVYAAKEEMDLVKKMLEKLDVPGMIKEAKLFTIELDRIDCNYMAGKIQQVFTPEELKRRRVQSGGSAQDLIPIRVVPEDMTNTLLITCAETDFADIRKFVMEREAAYVAKEKERKLITPKFASQGQLMAAITAIYEPPHRRGIRQKDVPDIRALPATGSSFYLEAPKDKMPDLLKLVEELDVEDKNQPIVRTYRVGDVNVSQLARLLSQTMAGKGTFIPDPQMGLLIVSAPEFRFAKIEETMNKLKENVAATRQQFKVFPLKFAKAANIYGQLSQLVSTRISSRRGSVDLSIMPDTVLNRLFVYAGDDEMKLVETMLGELDIEGVEPEQQVYSVELKNADCNWAASMVQQMFDTRELERRRRGRASAVVAPLRVMADQMSNRLLIWASPTDYKDVEKFVMDIDERAKDTKPERRIIEPKFIRATELYSMVQTLFLSQRTKTGQRQRFIETFMVMSGADIILNGPKDRLDEIEQFVKTVDTEDRAKLEIKTYELPEVDLNSLISTLNQLFAEDARRQRGNVLFIPDTQNNELMVSAPKSLMKDIDEIIVQRQKGAAKRTRTLTIVEIQHADASYLAGMLQPLIVERTRSRRGRYVQPEVTITPESRTNRLLIMAADAETKIAMELIKELDTEAMGLKGQVRTIELNKADVSYVASTLQAMFSGRQQLRKAKSYTATPVYIVPEIMTNRIFVAASEADFKDIEKLAKEMDEAAELQGIQEEKIEVKYANPSQLVGVITQMFQPMRNQGRRAESDVRLNVVGPNIIAQAPAKKMVEIRRWIKELDVEEFADTQTKFFPLDIARAREITSIIQPMLQAKAQEIALREGQRQRRGTNLVIIPDVRNNRMIITAPSQLLTMAGELIKELDVEDPVWTGETVEIVEIEKAEATAVAQVLTQILRDREGQEPVRPKKGGGDYTGLAVTIVPDAASNTLILKGLPRELDRVKALIEQIEQKSVAGGVQFKMYRLTESDAEEVATVVTQMVNAAAGARSRRTPVQVTSNYMMNAVFVAGTPNQQTMVQKIIDVFEKPEMEIDPDTGELRPIDRQPFEFIRLKYSDAYDLLYDLESLLEKQFGKKAPTLETLYGDSSVLMVSGNPNQIAAVRKLVDMFEEKNKSKPPVTRTVDLGTLKGDEIKQYLERWGYLGKKDTAEVLKGKDVRELVTEIGIDDAIKRIDEAKEAEEKAKELKPDEARRQRSTRRYRYNKTGAGGAVRFVPPSTLIVLERRLDTIVCGAAAVTKPATTAPAVRKAEPAAPPAKKADTTAERKNRFTGKPATATAPAQPTPRKRAPAAAAAKTAPTTAPAKVAREALTKPTKRAKPVVATTAPVKTPVAKVAPTPATKEPVRVAQPVRPAPKTPEPAPKAAAAKQAPSPPAKAAPRSVDAAAKAAPAPASALKTPSPAKLATPTTKPRFAIERTPERKPAKEQGASAQARPTTPSEGATAREAGTAFGAPATAAGDEGPPVTITIDEATGVVQIKGPDRRVKEMEDLIYRLQEELAPPLGREFEYKVYKPKYLDVNVAALLLDRVFNEPKAVAVPQPKQPQQPKGKKEEEEEKPESRMDLRDLMRTGRSMTRGAKKVRVVPDSRTGYIIVVAPPDMYRDIEDLLAKMDIPGLPPGDMQFFHLVNLDADDVERELKAVLRLDRRSAPKTPALPKDQNQALAALQAQLQQIQSGAAGVTYSSEQVVLVSNPTTNTLVVKAPNEVMDVITDYIETLEEEAANIEIEAVTLESAPAQQVAQSMTALYQQRGGVSIPGQGKAGGGRISFTADPSSNTIYVRGPKTLRDEAITRIKEVDEKTAEEGKVFRMTLENADPEMLAPKLQQMFAGKKRKGQQAVEVIGDNASNTLIVRAPEMIRKEIQEMAKALDVDAMDIDFRVIPLEHATATEVHEQLVQMTMQVMMQLRQKNKNMKMDVFAAVPDPRTNSLIVTGGPTTFAIVEKLKSQLDVEPRGITEQITVVYQLQQASAPEVARTITQLYKSGPRSNYLRKTGMEPPQADFDTTTNTVIVRTTEKLHKMIKKDIIDKLEEFSVSKKIKDSTIILKFAKSDEVAEILTEYFTQRTRFNRRGAVSPTDAVSVISEPNSNALLIRCNDDNLEAIQKLVAQMDREDVAGKSTRKTKVIQLEYADPGSAAQAIRQAFVQNGRRGRVGLKDRVEAIPEYTTGALVVVASEENMKEVDNIIAQLDVETAMKRETKQIKLEFADAAEVTQQLTAMYAQTRSRTRRGELPVTVTADERTNSVILQAKAKELAEVEGLIKTLDVPSDVLKRQKLRIFQLEWADPYAMAQTIMQAFRSRGGRRSPSQEVFAGAEYSTGSLIVHASPDNMAVIEQLVKEVDQEGASAKQMHVIEIKNGVAQDIAQALNQTFVYTRRSKRGGQPPVTIVSPPGTNQIMISANEGDFKRVEEAIKALDVDPTTNDEVEIVTLEHLDSTEALEIMQNYLQRPGVAGRRGDLAGGTRVTALDSMSAVVLSGKKENVSQATKVLKGLDVPSSAAERIPKMIPLAKAQPSLMASTLSQIFTEPAQQAARRRRGGAAQESVPLILSDEGSRSLIVRARKSDFNAIEQMAKQLDREDFGGAVKIISVPQTMDVAELAQQVERAVNEGERNLAVRTGRRASQVAVVSDERTSSLIVAGPSELFAQVEQIVKQLQEIGPAGAPAMRIIQLKNLEAQEISRVLDQMMERQGSGSSGTRRYRRRF
ncbi:MAG: hypothetical protein JXQ73_17535 [Phycisphaerae bacterium]|nr:hypothetical protein [Phycisphaerae bacterium]